MKIKKRRKIIILSFIFIIIALLVIALSTNVINIQQINENIRKSLYGEPIDLNTGIINNEYFNISSDGTNSIDTTKGLNKALEYCKKENIENVKLKEGEYLINDTINIPSNENINLNSSTIIMQENDETHYNIFRISNKENIIIKNGKLIGDKDLHNYSGNSTHEWGMGINIVGSSNVDLENLEISKMTGDGIYIASGESNSSNIKVENCLIHDNRRQGISIISGEQIEICNNEIYKIEGTSPQSGIDLEANNETQKIDNIDIHNNKIYDSASNTAVKLHSQVYNVKIRENIIYGNINVDETKEKTEIFNNQLNDGAINAGNSNENSTRIVNNLEILNNTLENYKILHNDKVNNIKIEGNKEI